MIIVDPVALEDAPCTRPSPKWVYDRTGTLVEVPANTLGVTYDPTDLSKAPFAVVDLEPATNHLRNNTMAGAAAGVRPNHWGALDGEGSPLNGISATVLGVTIESGIECLHLRYQGTASGTGVFGMYVRFDFNGTIPAQLEQKWAAGLFYRMRVMNGEHPTMRPYITERDAGGAALTIVPGPSFSMAGVPLEFYEMEHVASHPQVAWVYSGIEMYFTPGKTYDFTFAIGLPQLCRDRVTRFPIKTSNGAVTRAADVIGPAAGLIYSNVPMVEPPYDAAVTYAKDVLVRDPVTHVVYQSLIDANKGKLLTDEASWNARGKTNRWAMFDEYNNTQTTNPEEIVVVLSPQSICEGLYLGNVDADEIELVVVDQSDGKVYSEVISLVTASGSSSYYDWCFRPADRADYYFTVAMPPYAAALVTVVLRKAGGVAKCGMAAIGLVDDFGPSLYGLSASGKDFSSTTFNFDGTSKTQLRDYAKQMNVDVQVNNGEIDYIQRKLFQLRQRPIVWIGGPYGATAVFGRYVSFDIVIPGLLKSDMSLQIEGSV